jgi:hypothetical protein
MLHGDPLRNVLEEAGNERDRDVTLFGAPHETQEHVGPPTEPQLYFRNLIEHRLDLLGVCRVVSAERDRRCRLDSDQLKKHVPAWFVGIESVPMVSSGSVPCSSAWSR